MHKSSTRKHEERHVLNLSSKQLTDPQVSALSRGLNFTPTPKCVPKAHTAATGEMAITQLPAGI